MIFFNVKEAREYLLAHGIVYTLRLPRGVGNTVAVQGSRFKHTTLCNVKVEFETNIVSAVELIAYVEQSGFVDPTQTRLIKDRYAALLASASKWFALAFDMYFKKGKSNTTRLDLYKVTLL